MELIKDLEEKFRIYNDKIDLGNGTLELISSNNNLDCERMNTFFDSKQDRYKNGLNEFRDEMLKQLIQKRNEQLKEIDAFMENTQAASKSVKTIEVNNHVERVGELKTLARSIKLNSVSFRPSLISVSESIKSRTELKNEFKLVIIEDIFYLKSS